MAFMNSVVREYATLASLSGHLEMAWLSSAVCPIPQLLSEIGTLPADIVPLVDVIESARVICDYSKSYALVLVGVGPEGNFHFHFQGVVELGFAVDERVGVFGFDGRALLVKKGVQLLMATETEQAKRTARRIFWTRTVALSRWVYSILFS